MRKIHSFRTITAETTISLLVSFILIICVLLIIFFSSAITDTTTSSMEEIMTQLNSNVDYYISEITDIADYVRNLSRETDKQSRTAIRERMNTLIATRDDITRIAIYDLKGNRILTTDNKKWNEIDDVTDELWYIRALEGEGDFFFSGPSPQRLPSGENSLIISYSQMINYGDASTETMSAILLIDLNFNAISTISDRAKLSKSGYVYFLSNDNEIIYHPKQREIAEGSFTEDLESVEKHVYGTYISEYRGQRRLTIIQSVYQTRWRIVGIAYMSELTAAVNSFSIILLLIGFLMTIISVIVITAMTGRLTKPLRKLEAAMRTVETGNFNVKVPDGESREVQSLASSFRLMVRRISELMDKVKATEAVKRQRELDALQAKINPHFLYNTLDSVVWMAEKGDKEGVIKMVTSLASLFRISIAKGKDIITLKEELSHVKSYLEIQALRYKDKFVWSIDLPDEIADCPVIKLIVQPIVENSIYHGIKYLLDEGVIDITVSEDGGKIKIRIADNGVGMKEETLKSLLDPGKSHEHLNDGNGIGLLNIDERIKLCYGEEYGVSIKSELDEGTVVTLTIPKLPPIEPVIHLHG